MVIYLIGAVGEGVVLKHVNLLVIIAEIGIDELVVVGLAQVQNTLEATIDVFSHLDETLHVHVYTRALDDCGKCRVRKARTRPDIVAAVAYE